MTKLRINNKQIETVLIVFLVALTFYTWTLPIEDMPFGDVDSPVHFAPGDYMGQTNDVFLELPFYIKYRFGDDAKGKLPYPPQYATNEGIFQYLGGTRIKSVYLYIALGAILYIFASFLLIKELFGFMPAYLSSFLLIFSTRHYLTYLWAQWPQTLSFSFTPLIIYTFYKFWQQKQSRLKDDSDLNSLKKPYLLILSFLVVIQYLFHPMGIFVSFLFIASYFFIVLIRKRQLIFSIKQIIAVIALVLTLMFIFAPYQMRVTLGQMGIIDTGISSVQEGGIKLQYLGTLLQWYPKEGICTGCVSPNYFSYKDMHYGYWTLPLLFLGIGFLIFRRKEKDIFYLTYFIPIYLLMHLGVFNIAKGHRFFPLEAELFYPLVAIGFLGISSFINLLTPQIKTKSIKWVLFFIFLIVILFVAGKPTFSQMENVYSGIGRITPPQYAATEWMKDNLPYDAHVLLLGVAAPAKSKWVGVLAQKHGIYDYYFWGTKNEYYNITDHVYIDYSDYGALNNQQALGALAQWEKQYMGSSTLLYNKDNIRVYSLNDLLITPELYTD